MSGTTGWSMAPAEYLSAHDIEHYFSDALASLIKLRLQSPPQLKIPAALYLAKYFVSVREGRHVLFREYRYITSTDHSRRSFIKWFQHCLEPLTQPGATYSIADYYNLLTLMCKDFPLGLVKSAAAMLLVEDGLECLVSVTDFLTAFKLRLIHAEFLDRTEAMFGSYQATASTPSSEGFLAQLGPLCHHGICTIPIDMLRAAIDPINERFESTDVLDIFNCLVRSDPIRRLNDAPGLQPRAAGFFS